MSTIRSGLVIHGGAGVIRSALMTKELEQAYHHGLFCVVQAGKAVLDKGGSALDAVSASVMVLEDDPLFNAGRGSVFTTNYRMEMDAAIMDGRNRHAGGITGVCRPRHPILAARKVMETTEHVLLGGAGALEFCRQAGLEIMESSWFSIPRRRQALEAELERRRQGQDDDDPARKHGTVGAVACDSQGNLAAATSTGGMTAKMPGRVGDTPVIGAGTWADNATCAVSTTGHGEYFMRFCVGHEVDARVRWGGQSLIKAASGIIEELGQIGGSGGLIAINRRGEIALPFNCEGMYRGWIDRDGKIRTAIFHDNQII